MPRTVISVTNVPIPTSGFSQVSAQSSQITPVLSFLQSLPINVQASDILNVQLREESAYNYYKIESRIPSLGFSTRPLTYSFTVRRDNANNQYLLAKATYSTLFAPTFRTLSISEVDSEPFIADIAKFLIAQEYSMLIPQS